MGSAVSSILPAAGAAVGNFFFPGVGGIVGGAAGSALGGQFGDDTSSIPSFPTTLPGTTGSTGGGFNWTELIPSLIGIAGSIYGYNQVGDAQDQQRADVQALIDALTGGAGAGPDTSGIDAALAAQEAAIAAQMEMQERALAQQAAIYNSQLALAETQFGHQLGGQQIALQGTTDAFGNRSYYDPELGYVSQPNPDVRRTMHAGLRQQRLNATVEDQKNRELSERNAGANREEAIAAELARQQMMDARSGPNASDIGALLGQQGETQPRLGPASAQAVRESDTSNIPRVLSEMAGQQNPGARGQATLQGLQLAPQMQQQRVGQAAQLADALTTASTQQAGVPLVSTSGLAAAGQPPAIGGPSVSVPNVSAPSFPGAPNASIPQDNDLDPALLSALLSQVGAQPNMFNFEPFVNIARLIWGGQGGGSSNDDDTSTGLGSSFNFGF